MERKKDNKKKEQNRKRQKVGKKRNKKEIRKIVLDYHLDTNTYIERVWLKTT